KLKYVNGAFSVMGLFVDQNYGPGNDTMLYGPLPSLQALKAERPGHKLVRELVRAWDPVAHKTVWERETAPGVHSFDGGVLSTAGNLVIQGHGDGELVVYAADTGKTLKVIQTGSHIMAAPITYAVNGVQYIAVQAGYGGSAMTLGSFPA